MRAWPPTCPAWGRWWGCTSHPRVLQGPCLRRWTTTAPAPLTRLAPGAYEVLFPGLAHTPDIVAHVVSVAYEAARTLAGEDRA